MEVLGSEGLPLGGLTGKLLLLEERAVLVINSDRENIWLRLCMYRWFEDVTLRKGGVEGQVFYYVSKPGRGCCCIRNVYLARGGKTHYSIYLGALCVCQTPHLFLILISLNLSSCRRK